jgi:alcohol dehydrogenase
MKSFNVYQPTEIRFGLGRLNEIGSVVKIYGQRCLLVTGHTSQSKYVLYDKVKQQLKEAGVQVFHFDKVITNPTTDIVKEGVRLAAETNVNVVVGLGGGSSIDTAKAIAVGVTHTGSIWDYRIFGSKEITSKTLPIIAIPTTSGTGSHVTPVAVITNPAENFKSALISPFLCPRVCIVDPQLMLTVPKYMTAATGFDAFAHAFESYIHIKSSFYTDLLAREAIRLIIKYLPKAVKNGTDLEARTWLAWADTLAGICISNAGTVLPHGIAMAIGGHAPKVHHGEALAAIYLECMSFSCDSSPEKFATLGRMLNPELEKAPDLVAARKSVEEMKKFLRTIDLYVDLKSLGVSKNELNAIAEDSMKLPDYQVNPRVPTFDDVLAILEQSYERKTI